MHEIVDLDPGFALSNAAATQLYRKAGFYEVGRRKGYYSGGATALVLRRDLG